MKTNVKQVIFCGIIILGCILPWVKMGVFTFSGTSWNPAIAVLISASISAGFAFYSYATKEDFPWIAQVAGAIGLGVCMYAAYYGYEMQKSLGEIEGAMSAINWETMQVTEPIEKPFDFSVLAYVGIGYYLTLIGSVLLLFTYQKEEKAIDYTGFLKEYSAPNLAIPNPVTKWLQENPGKTINDYYLENRK